MIVRHLFDLLPEGFVSAPSVHLGKDFEIPVVVDESDSTRPGATRPNDGGRATTTSPAPTLTLEAELPEEDEFEVRVYDTTRGRQLVAAIELVSPSNKDRPEHRQAFVSKVARLLQQDVCVSIVDLVTIRQFNLYEDLLEWIGGADPQLGPEPPYLYAATIRGRKRPGKRSFVDMWFYPMALGQPLPTLPIWLDVDLRVLLPLEPSYEETCRLLRIA